MNAGTQMNSRAVRMTIAIGVLIKIVVIVLSNLILGAENVYTVTGLWIRYAPSLVADGVIGFLYVYFHLPHLTGSLLRADVGGKGGFISSLAIHAITGILAIFFGLCGTILELGDPSHTESLTSVAVGLMNLWLSEYRLVLTTRGIVILIGSMLSAISGALCASLISRPR